MTPKTKVKDRLIAPPAGRRVRLSLFLEVPAIMVTLIMMLHVSLNALLRAFASAPMPYTLEITEYWYMPIIVFLGFIAAQMRGEHVKADLIFNLLPTVTRRYVLAVAYIIITIVCIGFAWFSGEAAMEALRVQRHAGVSPVIAWPTYFLSPFAFGVMTIQFALASWHSFRGESVAESNELDDIAIEEEEFAKND